MAMDVRRLVAVVGVAAAGVLSSVSGAVPAAGAGPTGVAPNPVNELDCNGLSPIYRSVKPGLGGLCTDPIWPGTGGPAARFYDNGRYIGHDEPSVKFISTAPGSGSSMTYVMRLAVDPAAAPTGVSGAASVTDYAQLSPAPWFGLPICDPLSYPQNPCAASSDANQGQINNPNAAGSAFMELQFYPPGYPPFIDAPSCSATQWCAALNIDSLECTFGFATCNSNCLEPVNFAFLQMNGQPAGPPSPQLTDVSTFTPNAETLMMNPGDVLVVDIRDTQEGLLTRVTDLSTGQSGFIVASAANGFMDTNIANCTGVPFNFRPEYSTASQQNQVPWAALEGGVLMEDEIGHFEACSSVTNAFPFGFATPTQSFSDPTVSQTCVGGAEGSGNTGEGCNLTTLNCPGATTQAGATCPAASPVSGLNCEYSDANCMPAGPRSTFTTSGAVTTETTVSWPVAGCQQDVFQNGDLDYDGSSYRADGPDGSPSTPTSFQYLGPFSRGRPYPEVQFETDAAASEFSCNVGTGIGCAAPPAGAAFYPFWSLGTGALPTCGPPNQGGPTGSGGGGGTGGSPGSNGGGAPCRQGGQGPSGAQGMPGRGVCGLWNFGNVIPGVTLNSFGQDQQYGVPDTARFGGTLTSPVLPNPQFQESCGSG